jgi:predicted RNase H-like nuclease (RuvC/YqgF family)
MTLLNTLNHLIEEFEADLEELSLELREEINYEPIHKSEYQFRDSIISQLQSDLEEKKQHLNNLKEIKKTLEELSQDDSTASQDAL